MICSIAFCQVKERNEPILPTRYFIAVQDTPTNIKGIKILDSILSLRNDTAIIAYSQTGDITLNEEYFRLYENGSGWVLEKTGKTAKAISTTPEWLRDYDKHISLKYIMYQNGNLSSSLIETYVYVLIVKNKIIEMLSSNKKISELSKLDPVFAPDVNFFEKCEGFISQINLQ